MMMTKRITVFLFIFFWGSAGWAIDYDKWDALLKQYTSTVELGGINVVGVDYRGIKEDVQFHQLISDFEREHPRIMPSVEDKLAFWLNAYNFFTIKLVIDHYPIASIQEVGDIFHPVGEKPVAKIGGKVYSLDEIKHSILRQQFNEPLIHTALANASLSGPDLRRTAFRPATVRQQLQEQLRAFLENPKKGFQLEREQKTLYLSLLFTWDAEDFKKWGGIINFVEKFVPPGEKDFLDNNRYQIKYFDYNWDLNVWSSR